MVKSEWQDHEKSLENPICGHDVLLKDDSLLVMT